MNLYFFRICIQSHSDVIKFSLHFLPFVILSENRWMKSLSRWILKWVLLVKMMLTNTTNLPSLTPDTSIQPGIMSRVKPLELTLTSGTSSLLVNPHQGVVPSMSIPTTQSLQEVSIHKSVIPPRTLSPPLCPSLCRPASAQGPPSSLLAHPREGQSASLLGGKYILLDELEGSTLHRCLDIQSQEELVCKVRNPDVKI